MKFLFPFLLSILFFNAAKGRQQASDSLMTVLKAEILKKDSYDRKKEYQVKKLKASLLAIPKNNISARYAILGDLIEAYRSYNFDSAHVYTYQLMQVSTLLKDRQKLNESKIRLGALQLSWGMYKEAFDCIGQLNANFLPDSSKLRFYELKARALNDWHLTIPIGFILLAIGRNP